MKQTIIYINEVPHVLNIEEVLNQGLLEEFTVKPGDVFELGSDIVTVILDCNGEYRLGGYLRSQCRLFTNRYSNLESLNNHLIKHNAKLIKAENEEKSKPKITIRPILLKNGEIDVIYVVVSNSQFHPRRGEVRMLKKNKDGIVTIVDENGDYCGMPDEECYATVTVVPVQI